MYSIVWAIFFLSFLQISLSAPRQSEGTKLLYILLDGFRYDYLDRQREEDIPGFRKFLEGGVRAKWMKPIFPSISWPDWTTLLTGLYPESHGIVGNSIYDAQEKDKFYIKDYGRKKWYTKEPIWTTATKAGIKTGVIRWGRCDVPFDDVVPYFCENFALYSSDHLELFKKNIDKATNKLENNFDFILLFTEYLDVIGHSKGPESEELDKAVQHLDSIILYLQEQLKRLKLAERVNVILVSDHGMVTAGPRRVEMDDYLPLEYIEMIVESKTHSNIKVLPGHVDEVYERAKRMPGVEVYKHDDIPDSFHFKNHKYIHDIVIRADIDTVLMASHSDEKMFPTRSDETLLGLHGYDPNEEKMRAIFFAKGPDFKRREVIEPIKNVDVYPLLAKLLSVPPQPHNGSLDATSALEESVSDAALNLHWSSFWTNFLFLHCLFIFRSFHM